MPRKLTCSPWRALGLPAILAVTVVVWACGGSAPDSATPDQAATDTAGSSSAASDGAEPEADSAIELEYWQSVKDSNDADQLLAYIKKYPEGRFVELAELKLKNLTLADPNVAGPGASDADPPAGSGSSTRSSTTPPPPAVAPPASSTTAPKKQRASSSSRGETRQQRVLRVVRSSIGRYSDPRLYIAPNIPRRKADNAASVHGIDPRSILVLYDDGLGGGGKTGFVLTDRRVYWRFISGAQALYLDFADIQGAVARKNKFLLNGYEIGTTMSEDSRYAAEVYADLMMDLRDAFR
ncbi:MAG: hypothetical protein AAGC60_26480 [Acidobacteriota bacterium]